MLHFPLIVFWLEVISVELLMSGWIDDHLDIYKNITIRLLGISSVTTD